MRKHSFQEGIADKCIALCIEKGYLDNRRFAEIYIRSLLERGKSKRAILMKMKEHRLDASVAESLLAELDDGKQSREMLKEQIIKLMRKHHEEEPRKAKEKIYASLYRKGFSLDEIADAWRDLKNHETSSVWRDRITIHVADSFLRLSGSKSVSASEGIPARIN